MNSLANALEAAFDGMAPELLEIYKDLHRHPELSMQEHRTAGIAADYIEKLGYTVTREVGVTGVVGVLRNGDGPMVMLRGDKDALPMAEDTGLPYASQATATDADGQQVSVAHSCGHDLHVTWLMGAAKPASASEDFSVFGRRWNVPYVFWFVGGTDPQRYLSAKREGTLNAIPSNHSPRFAPVLEPTLKVGLQAMLSAASAWLCAGDGKSGRS
jgi:metal-dependent amidase/aminoacylase/carboxypeptidase family protein